MFAFIYWATSMPPTDRLLLCGYHASPHPPMHRYLPLWLSLQHTICVWLRLINNQNKMTLQSNVASRDGILIGGWGNRECYVSKNFERQQK